MATKLWRDAALEVSLAAAAKGVHEVGGNNHGKEVEEYLASVGAPPGTPWCAAFKSHSFIVAAKLDPSAKLDMSWFSAGVANIRDAGIKNGWKVTQPEPGDLGCMGSGWPAKHIFQVVEVLPGGALRTVEGNTSPAPTDQHQDVDGDVVTVKVRAASQLTDTVYIRVPGVLKVDGVKEWIAWQQAGKPKGKRPHVPAKIPAAWWKQLEAANKASKPTPAKPPAKPAAKPPVKTQANPTQKPTPKPTPAKTPLPKVDAKTAALRVKLKLLGIEYPLYTIWAARRTGLELAVLCAVLEQESGGGANVFGHDPTIFAGAGRVTRSKYEAYKKARGTRGQGGMQGVGPMQLTYFSYQDEADKLGGCWKPRWNIQVGADILAEAVRRHGLWNALKAYNGSAAYADKVNARVVKWRKLLA